MPRIQRVLETALYFDDLPRASAFYRDILGAGTLYADDRLVALDAGGGTVLLLFQRGATARGLPLPTGFLPPHDGSGPVHVALAISAAELPAWERHLAASGVDIESRIRWPRGGQSLYFRDPERHSIELATPGVWATY